ncbi:MAG: phosphoribosyl-ATP diphosphatase [Eubacterium sp.]
MKGETSGHYQYVKSLTIDCDRDTILAKVSKVGAACHTGNRTCFFTDLVKEEYSETNPLKVFEHEYSIIMDRKLHPKEGSYTNYLFDKGIDKILKKVGEEATEIVIAAKNPNAEEIKYEIADFLTHDGHDGRKREFPGKRYWKSYPRDSRKRRFLWIKSLIYMYILLHQTAHLLRQS